MRALRFVRPGDDGNHVIVETADRGEQFRLLLDVALRDATRVDLPKLRSSPPSSEATISPREIQVRVRAGASPQDLAEEHALTLERVLRFAGAVLEERSRIAHEARHARARRSTTEGQTVVFGEAVDERFSAHGIDPSTVSWDAHRRDDGQWIVTAGWLGEDLERVAEWVFHLSARNVTPVDDSAADLLSDRPIRPAASADEPARPSLVAAPPLPYGAHPDVLPGAAEVDEFFDQDAPEAVARRAPADSAGPDAGEHAPALPLRLAEPMAAPPARDATVATVATAATTPTLPKLTNLGVASRDSDRDRAARPKVPTWDDILLGVRRKGD